MNNLPLAATATLAAALSSGCQAHLVASQSSHPTDVERVALPEATWAFERHSFGAYCYNTIGCKVLYANYYHVRDEEDELAPPPDEPGVQRYWSAIQGSIDNFPRPALVSWRSLDGMAHKVEVDIGALFKEQRVIHDVPTEKLSALATRGGSRPGIVLVVDDLTISVYMRAFVSLKEPEVPGNAHSDVRYRFVLVHRHTY